MWPATSQWDTNPWRRICFCKTFQTFACCRFPLLAFVRKRLFNASQRDKHVNRSLAKFICNICIIQEINVTILFVCDLLLMLGPNWAWWGRFYGVGDLTSAEGVSLQIFLCLLPLHIHHFDPVIKKSNWTKRRKVSNKATVCRCQRNQIISSSWFHTISVNRKAKRENVVLC